MRSIKKQNGIATVILTILVGLAIMTVTVTVVRSQVSKRESGSASHAQTNAQMLSWAGVDAFRQHIIETGGDNFEDIEALNGQSLVLKDNDNKKVNVTNIRISNCDPDEPSYNCQIEADISAVNKSSKSSTTINTLFDVDLSSNQVVQQFVGNSSFGGGLELDGELSAEVPNSNITLNVDGDVEIGILAKSHNIKELTINSCNGDVKITCGYSEHSFCQIPKINIYSCGNVTITDLLPSIGNFGDIYAKGNVDIFGSRAENIYSLGTNSRLVKGNVDIANGTQVENVFAIGSVKVHTASSAGYIEAGGNVHITGIGAESYSEPSLGDGSDDEDADDNEVDSSVEPGADEQSEVAGVKSNSNVALWLGGSARNIQAGGKVDVHSFSKAQNIEAGGDINVIGVGAKTDDLLTNRNAYLRLGGSAQNIKAHGGVKLRGVLTLVRGNVIAKGSGASPALRIWAYATIEGNAYVNGLIRVNHTTAFANPRIKGNAYSSSDINNGAWLNDFTAWPHGMEGRWFKNVSDPTKNLAMASMPLASTQPIDLDELSASIEETIDQHTSNLKSYVSVFPYKDEANYIFTKVNGFSRVFLNKVKNPSSEVEYLFENNKQYEVFGGNKSELNGPFYIGKYQYNGSTYVGAICEQATAGTCTSNIIGYLPRISLKEFPTPDRDVDQSSIIAYLGSIIDNLVTDLTELTSNFLFGGSYQEYQYAEALNGRKKFVVSSMAHDSSLESPNLAPGIMYFDDDLVIRGRGRSVSTGADASAFVNTFLSEGNIDAALYSPNIYSPYNLKRELSDSDFCNRSLQTVSGSDVGSITTSPMTLSDKYLRATNLCSSANSFAYNMNRDSDNPEQLTSVAIDGNVVPKLDLGFVALMSNKTIRLMFCSQIYGDVIAKGAIRTTTDLVCGGGDRQTVTGNMVSETGQNSHIGSDTNKIHAGSRYVVADPEYSNYDGGQEVEEILIGTIKVDDATLKWVRVK